MTVDEQVQFAMNYYETDQMEGALNLLNWIVEKHDSAYVHERRGHILCEAYKEELPVYFNKLAIALAEKHCQLEQWEQAEQISILL